MFLNDVTLFPVCAFWNPNDGSPALHPLLAFELSQLTPTQTASSSFKKSSPPGNRRTSSRLFAQKSIISAACRKSMSSLDLWSSLLLQSVSLPKLNHAARIPTGLLIAAALLLEAAPTFFLLKVHLPTCVAHFHCASNVKEVP